MPSRKIVLACSPIHTIRTIVSVDSSSLISNMTIFVCFEGKVPASRNAISGQYYTTLQKLLEKQSGFISETPFLSLDQEGQQVLIARFANEESLHAWRKEHTHLKVESKARETIFIDYRIRTGPEMTDEETIKDDESGIGKVTQSKGHILLLYQYPAPGDNVTSSTGPTLEQGSTSEIPSSVWRSLADASTYRGEKDMLQISCWTSKADAVKVRDAIHRVDGDSIHLIRVERDYGKYNRVEAPQDADEAQAAAMASEEKK